MVSAGVDFMGDDYLEYIEPFVSTFQVAFLSDDWFTCCRLDKRLVSMYVSQLFEKF